MKDKNSSLLSDVFGVIRFPLIISVIFIHVYSKYGTVIGSYDYIAKQWAYPMLYYISYLFSQVLSRVAVPLFFFMSGYLFFYNVDTFDNSTYLVKLKKRIKTLLVPYLFWNLLYGLVLILLKEPFGENFHGIKDLPKALMAIFWGVDSAENVYPVAYQFWFIRDLFVCVLISPVLYYFVKRTSWWGICALLLLWLIDFKIPYLGVRGFSTTAIFFFSAGAWFCLRSIDVVNYVKDFKIVLILYPLWALADLCTKSFSIHLYIHNLGILIGIVFWFVSAALLLKKRLIKPVPFLASCSFFIFAIHDPVLLDFVTRYLKDLVADGANDLVLSVIYFLSIMIVAVIGVSLYWTLNKLTPRFISMVTGNR